MTLKDGQVLQKTLSKISCTVLIAIVAFGTHAEADNLEYSIEYIEDSDTDLVDAVQSLKPLTLQGRVGVVINHRDYEGGRSPEYIASAYQAVFDTENTLADYRVTVRDEQGTAIYFVVNGLSQGPFNINEAYEALPDIAAQNRFAHNLD